jgi:hypothetical protein
LKVLELLIWPSHRKYVDASLMVQHWNLNPNPESKDESACQSQTRQRLSEGRERCCKAATLEVANSSRFVAALCRLEKLPR